MKLNVPIIEKYYDLENVNLRNYNLVLMSHVLEHFYSPKNVLRKLYLETESDVLLIMLIPAIRTSTKYVPLHKYWFRIVHLYYFSSETVEDLLLVTDWKILKKHELNGEISILASKRSVFDPKVAIRNNFPKVRCDYLHYKRKVYLRYYYKEAMRKVKRVLFHFKNRMVNK